MFYMCFPMSPSYGFSYVFPIFLLLLFICFVSYVLFLCVFQYCFPMFVSYAFFYVFPMLFTMPFSNESIVFPPVTICWYSLSVCFFYICAHQHNIMDEHNMENTKNEIIKYIGKNIGKQHRSKTYEAT